MAKIDEKKVKEELQKLVNLIEDNGAKSIISNSPLEDYYDYITFCYKYVLFDRDALKRENELLRKMLEAIE